MKPLPLHEFHASLRGQFSLVNGMEVVRDYGDVPAEHATLRKSAAILDLSFRSRICLIGSDRQKFLNGQVTNNVKDLRPGQGCYAALTTAKGKMESDVHVFCLEDEILADFEPGLTEFISQRLEKYIIADDVQVVDVAPHYGLLSIQGPAAADVVRKLDLDFTIPRQPLTFSMVKHETAGELYLMAQPRIGTVGFDLFLPTAQLETIARRITAAVETVNGRWCGWDALEIARIEAGVPRFGVDMDGTNLVPETGLEQRAISYTKGCYIGQEVIARIRTYGQVAKSLRGLRMEDAGGRLPQRGDKLLLGGKEVGYITSATFSPTLRARIALGYLRREVNQQAELLVRTATGDISAKIVDLPFVM